MAEYAQLRLLADMYDDLQQFRIAQANKVRSGTVDPDIVALPGHYQRAETEMSAAMTACLRATAPPLVLAWQQDSAGIGEHLLARLLGRIGDPYITTPYHWEGSGPGRSLVAGERRKRRVDQLWAYCGHGDPARTIRRNMTAADMFALGSPRAKMIVYLMALWCIRHRQSLYRGVYDDARARYASRAHAADCLRCGPRCHPAAPASPWSPAHQHAAALRKTGKTILRDLWRAARAHHLASLATTTPEPPLRP